MPGATEIQWVAADARNRPCPPCSSAELLRAVQAGELSPDAPVRLLPGGWAPVAEASRAELWAGDAGPPPGDGVAPPRACIFWSYLDAAGHEQGPFPTAAMEAWRREGHFPGATLCRAWPHGWVTARSCMHLLAAAEPPCAESGEWAVIN